MTGGVQTGADRGYEAPGTDLPQAPAALESGMVSIGTAKPAW